MKLFTGEEVILTSNEDKLVLTNQRVILQSKDWLHNLQSTIFLEDISSMGTKYRPNQLLFTISLIFLFLGVINIICLIIGIALLLFWFLLKQPYIYIASTGTTELFIEANQLNKEQVLYFLDALQEAKANRVRSLHHP